MRAEVAIAAMLMTGCLDAEDSDVSVTEQGSIMTRNGLSSINGLSSANGLGALNGIMTRNGMAAANGIMTRNGVTNINGLQTVNGLATTNGSETGNALTGLATANGLPVPSGAAADGMLSPTTGMLSNPDGISLATVVVACALRADQTIKLRTYSGTATFTGAYGLAPQWMHGYCGKACMERVSACLIAFAHADEVPVLELSSGATNGDESVCPGNKDTCNQARTSDDDGKLVLGLHDPQVPVRQQEGVFFGNLFVTPPQAYWATGADRTDNIVAARLCSGWRSDDVCPFLRVGAASTVCGQNKGTATVCNANGQQWANAITVFK